MRAEFLRPAGDGSELVAAAKWTGSAVEFEPRAADGRGILERIFRPASVAVDDPALRSFGTSGEVTLQPGSARWFMAAARTRGQAEGLEVRFVAGRSGVLGWDPAGAYRTFTSNAERLGAERPTPSGG